MRFQNVRIAVFCVSMSVLVFAFQNCSKFSVQDNPPESTNAAQEADDIFAKLAECPTDNWASYCQSTQKAPIDWHDYVSFEPIDDTRALVYNGYQTFIFSSTTRALTQIHSDELGQHYGQMGFPSLNRVVLLIHNPKTQMKHLYVYDVNTGKRLFKSAALASSHSPCLFNPKDEKDGIILCSIPRPTPNKASEVQATLFDVKTLSFTDLAPIPDNYNWDANFPSGGPNLYYYMMTYPYPKEKKAIVQVYDSQRNEVLLALTPESATSFSESTVYDYNGSGNAKSFTDFANESIGFSDAQDGCPADLDQYPTYWRIGITSSKKVESLCVNGKVWTYRSSSGVELLECTAPGSCLPVPLNLNGDTVFTSGSEPGYLKGSGKLYSLVSLRANGQVTLVSVDTSSKQIEQIPVPVVANESVVDYPSLARIEIPLLRWYKNSYVSAMRFYVRDLGKTFDLPLIPHIGKANLYLSSARTVNGKSYVYGFAQYGNDSKTLIVQDNQDWVLLDESLVSASESYNNFKDSPFIILKDTTQVWKYDISTNQKVAIGTIPAGYKPNRGWHVSPYSVIEYSNTTASANRRLIVYKNQQVIYTRDGKLNHLIPTNDNTGFWAVFENAGSLMGSFGLKYNYMTESATSDVVISNTGLVESIVYTFPTANDGEFLITQGGRIYDSQFNLVLAAGILALGPRQNNAIGTSTPKFKYAYFVKWQKNPNDISQTLSYLYRYNFSARKMETLIEASAEWHGADDDYVITLTENPASNKGSISVENQSVVDLPGLRSYGANEKYFHFYQRDPAGNSTYSYISRSQVKAAADAGQKAQATVLQPPSADATLDSIVGEEVWWRTQYGMQGVSHIITTLPK